MGLGRIAVVIGIVLPLAAWASDASMPPSETFTTAAAASAHCPADVVVWANFAKSKAFHLAASHFYGKTKHGAYACEKDALAAGFHAAKN